MQFGGKEKKKAGLALPNPLNNQPVTNRPKDNPRPSYAHPNTTQPHPPNCQV